jgi:hypothetical protein
MVYRGTHSTTQANMSLPRPTVLGAPPLQERFQASPVDVEELVGQGR